jgi:hypothetical protein
VAVAGAGRTPALRHMLDLPRRGSAPRRAQSRCRTASSTH